MRGWVDILSHFSKANDQRVLRPLPPALYASRQEKYREIWSPTLSRTQTPHPTMRAKRSTEKRSGIFQANDVCVSPTYRRWGQVLSPEAVVSSFFLAPLVYLIHVGYTYKLILSCAELTSVSVSCCPVNPPPSLVGVGSFLRAGAPLSSVSTLIKF